MRGKDLHPRLLYPAKLSFGMEGKIKCFSDKVKLKKFNNMNSKMTTNSQLSTTEPKKTKTKTN